MTSSEKKQEKARQKREKKAAKAEVKAEKKRSAEAPAEPGPSPAVRYAVFVRGALYVLTGGSLATALVLGQRGLIVSLDDLIESLFAATAGKVVLALIAVALVIYGLKHLRLVR